ncbi:MAG: glycosyltransferase family 2 protein [Chloroflexi bacterium]|nr:glycosyltransferase family 2 protein [Chloroflexota bacterium]
MSESDLTIAIVSWNVAPLLERCLRSIETALHQGSGAALRAEVIVVDNASADGSAQLVAAKFPWVQLLGNSTNVGFARACNQAIRVSNSRYIMVLNSDTEIIGDALVTMISYMDRHPQVGVLGPQLLDNDGTALPSRRRFPTLATAFIESTPLQRLFSRHLLLQRYYVADQPAHVVQEIDWLAGACLLARREAIDQVGPMDERFFLYSEELDWCRRMKTAEWKVVYFPEASVLHHEGKSAEQNLAMRQIYFDDSKCKYFGKYHGAFAEMSLRGFLFLTYLFQLTEEAAKWAFVARKRPLHQRQLAILSQVIRWQLTGRGQRA